jgi:hypothetical protein
MFAHLRRLRFASHNLPCLSRLSVETITPQACRAAPAPAAARPTPRIPLRGMLVAEYRANEDVQ